MTEEQYQTIIRKLIYYNIQRNYRPQDSITQFGIKFDDHLICEIADAEMDKKKMTYSTLVDNFYQRIIGMESEQHRHANAPTAE